MHTSSWSRWGLPVARLIWAGVTSAAIIATLVEVASRSTINPFNFFGYFTIQSNSLTILTGALAGTIGLIRPGLLPPRWLILLRSLTTTCMVIVGLVYAILLAPLGLEGGVPVPWANWVTHLAGPILVLADWVFAGDREPLPWRSAFLQLVYPIAWTVVVLIRGATDGWVPYPFLDPAQGYATVTLYVLLIAVTFLAVSTAVVWWSRVRRRRS